MAGSEHPLPDKEPEPLDGMCLQLNKYLPPPHPRCVGEEQKNL